MKELLVFLGGVIAILGISYLIALADEIYWNHHLCTCKGSRQPSKNGYCAWCHVARYGL